MIIWWDEQENNKSNGWNWINILIFISYHLILIGFLCESRLLRWEFHVDCRYKYRIINIRLNLNSNQPLFLRCLLIYIFQSYHLRSTATSFQSSRFFQSIYLRYFIIGRTRPKAISANIWFILIEWLMLLYYWDSNI